MFPFRNESLEMSSDNFMLVLSGKSLSNMSQLRKVLRRIKMTNTANVKGLHCHIKYGLTILLLQTWCL